MTLYYFNNYSLDEMGKYDIPASIKYVLKVTGEKSLSYVGHSTGCTVLFIALNYQPELNENIDTMIAFAPVSANGNNKLSYSRTLSSFVKQIMVYYILYN